MFVVFPEDETDESENKDRKRMFIIFILNGSGFRTFFFRLVLQYRPAYRGTTNVESVLTCM